MNPRRIIRLITVPPRSAEFIFWVLLIALAGGIRLYMMDLLPVALWSKDTGSYASTAFEWMRTGNWTTDPRRGPVYSLFIALCLKTGGSVHSIMSAQHLLGFLAVVWAVGCYRIWLGTTKLAPLMACGMAYAVYSFPLMLEHTLRNETLLFFFSSIALGAWLLALQRNQDHWLWLAGISSALLSLTKNVFAPFPLIVIAGAIYLHREQLKRAAKPIGIFVLAFLIPVAAEKVFTKFAGPTLPPEPQAGILFYGRTAQFTVLDGGIHPELKEKIRRDVEDYRKLPKLDNNIILKRTVVPELWRLLKEQGKTPSDLNRLCWELGMEAVNANRLAYAKQIGRDFVHLVTLSLKSVKVPSRGDLTDNVKLYENLSTTEPLLDLAPCLKGLELGMQPGHFKTFRDWVSLAWLFRFFPMLLTTLLLPVFFFRAKDDATRVWWAGTLVLWLFTITLLSTVGRPLDRYLIPVLPILFWTLSSCIIAVWNRMVSLIDSRPKNQTGLPRESGKPFVS